MAALTANKLREEKDGLLVIHPVVASDVIYQGAIVKHNAAGYLAPMAAEAAGFFAGIAYEECDNSAGIAGAKECRVKKSGLWLMDGAGFSQADVGSVAYASDDTTVSTTQGANEIAVGKISQYVSATQVWVRIDGYAY